MKKTPFKICLGDTLKENGVKDPRSLDFLRKPILMTFTHKIQFILCV